MTITGRGGAPISESSIAWDAASDNEDRPAWAGSSSTSPQLRARQPTPRTTTWSSDTSRSVTSPDPCSPRHGRAIRHVPWHRRIRAHRGAHTVDVEDSMAICCRRSASEEPRL